MRKAGLLVAMSPVLSQTRDSLAKPIAKPETKYQYTPLIGPWAVSVDVVALNTSS